MRIHFACLGFRESEAREYLLGSYETLRHIDERLDGGNLLLQRGVLGAEGLDLAIQLLGGGEVDGEEVFLVEGVEVINFGAVDEKLVGIGWVKRYFRHIRAC